MVSALSGVRECPIRCHPQRVWVAARRRDAGGAKGDWGMGWGLEPGLVGAGGRPQAPPETRRFLYRVWLCDPG